MALRRAREKRLTRSSLRFRMESDDYETAESQHPVINAPTKCVFRTHRLPACDRELTLCREKDAVLSEVQDSLHDRW